MLLVRSVVIVLLGLCTCFGQEAEDFYGKSQSVVSAKKNQDVAILKQIHRHNEDGSYTYGYEGADGSFKIETKTRSGEVTGKYGYVDDLGKLRVVEYGANRHGFQPSGEGITVPPPTLVQLRTDDDDDVDGKNDEDDAVAAAPEARRPRPPQQAANKRPSPVKAQQQNELPASRDYEYDDGFAQQQQRQQQPTAGFDDGDSPAGWAVQRPDDQPWARQPQKPEPAAARPRVPAQLYRPAPPTAARLGAALPKSPPRPAVGGSFEPAPVPSVAAEGPSGSYRSVQDFGAVSGARRDPSAGRRLAAAAAAAAAERSYETYENQESDTEPPLYRPVATKTAARRNGGGVPAGFAAAPSARQMRAGGVLDQLAEQYALPESGSPVSHSVAFGLDQ